MPELKIDLSSFSERFATNSKELTISPKVNFVFGKNGTGKTTISEAIKNQFGITHNVCIFDGYEGIIGKEQFSENHRLDAIALGTENAKIQTQIDEIEKNIAEIKKEIEKTEDKPENFFTKAEQAKKEFDIQNKKIEIFYTNSARDITTTCGLGRSYNTKNFQEDIKKNPKLLSDGEIKNYKATIKADQKKQLQKKHFQ